MTKILDQYTISLEENNIKLNPAQEQILKLFAKLHNDLTHFNQKLNPLKALLHKKTTPQGIYLYGSVGTGKSMLSDLFFNSLKSIKKHKTHFHSFMLEVHHQLHDLKKNHKNIDVLKHIAKFYKEKYQILYIDELYISDIADAMIVGKLFRELIANDIVIILTSNFAPDDLYKDGLQRQSFIPFIDLIKEEMHIEKMGADIDYRTVKLKSVKSTYYIYKDSADSQKFISDSFAKLTNNAPNKSLELDIDGRKLNCPNTALDCACFSFDHLCRASLGSADYIAICEQFNIIIIAEIPKLTSEEHNEAKRFINLIDTIYSYKRLLICSSHTDIDSIYIKGKWEFEFTRSASRLHEMQSEDYLQHYYIDKE